MIYQLTIDDDKAKSVIAFLKQLDFVGIKSIDKAKVEKKITKKKVYDIPYFGACSMWDIDAKTLRLQSTEKRNQTW